MILAFEGWNDAGEAATTALRFVNDAIHSVPLAEIDPEEFYDFTVRRPTSSSRSTMTSARIEWPSNEFRYGSHPMAREIVIGIGVEPHLRWRKFCDEIVDLAARPRRSPRRAARRVPRRRRLLAAGRAHGLRDDDEMLELPRCRRDGATRGRRGSSACWPIGSSARASGTRASGPACRTTSSATPNPRGALALVQKLTECLDFRIDDGAAAGARRPSSSSTISKVVAGGHRARGLRPNAPISARTAVRRLKRRASRLRPGVRRAGLELDRLLDEHHGNAVVDRRRGPCRLRERGPR